MQDKRLVTYCIVPPELADELHDVLREHYRFDPNLEVLVEQRSTERRRKERRAREATPPEAERRRIRARGGRRIAERRAVQAAVQAPELPPEAEEHRERLRFVERLEPTTVEREDADTARLVARLQAGDADIFTRLYERYFDRVYAYLRLTLQDSHEAEDVAQEVFIRVLQALPKYERRSSPFRAWLFRIVRNQALDRLRQRGRLRVESPEEMAALSEAAGAEGQTEQLDWLDDRQLLGLIEHLPLAQRQVIVLRYMLELRSGEIGEVLERSPEAVRQLHQRAMRFLRKRLENGGSAGTAPRGGGPGAKARRARASRPTQRNPSRRLLRQAPVLRSRRFALR
jgi:RNA polymerase sigma-70 factor (ECF subfamily)